MSPHLPPGIRVVISALSERPLEDIDHAMRIEEYPAPDIASLGPNEVLIAIRIGIKKDRSHILKWEKLFVFKIDLFLWKKPSFTRI